MGKDRPFESAQESGEVTAERPKFQFYGRRKGKPLRRLHAGLMDNLLPALAVNLKDPLAGRQQRVMLEIGFGGGEHLAHQAASHPDVAYLGAEPFLNGVAKLLAEIEKRDIKNIAVHYGDARVLLEAMPSESLARIYLLYPDPWPKERQKKRRLINAENLAHFARVLRPMGEFWFASDIEDYVNWTREHVATSQMFVDEGNAAEPFSDWVQTRYEAKAKREGRSSAYLRFRKV